MAKGWTGRGLRAKMDQVQESCEVEQMSTGTQAWAPFATRRAPSRAYKSALGKLLSSSHIKVFNSEMEWLEATRVS